MTRQALDWAEQYAQTMDDHTTLRHMLQVARKEEAGAEELMAALNHDPNDHMMPGLVVERDDAFRAKRMIEARLAELGVPA